jgi:DNA repair protein RadC
MSRVNIYKTKVSKESLLTTLVKEKGYNYNGDSLNSPEAIYQMMEDIFHMSDNAEEYCYLLCLNTKNALIGVFEISHGTVNSSLVGMREIFVRALLCGATNIILVHNHPSQNATPSTDDVKVTKKLSEGATLLGLSLLDHIIIGSSYYSLKESGLM